MINRNNVFYSDTSSPLGHTIRADSAATFFPGLRFTFSRSTPPRSVTSHSWWLSSRVLLNTMVIGITDSGSLALALAGGGVARYLVVGNLFTLPASALLLIPAWWVGASIMGLLPGWGLSAADYLRKQAVLVTALFSFGAVLLFFTKTADATSRLSIGSAWLIAMIMVPTGRSIIRNILCRQRAYGVPTVIFGRTQAVKDIADRVRAEPGMGYLLLGVCSDEPAEEMNGLPVVGDLDNIRPLAPAAIVVSTGMDADTNRRVINRVLSVYGNVTILPNLGDVPSSFVESRDLSGAIGLEISQTLFSPLATHLKRAIDLFLVLGTAPLWAPVMGAACLAIWLSDRHSPIFRQERLGRNARVFQTLKIRTMVPNAEVVLETYLQANPELRTQWERDFKLKSDPRITWLGRFLRRTSIDELPQLINVIRGEMALIGPRPLPTYHLEKMSGGLRELRTQVRPGLTGLWQVSGRSDTGTEGMTRWDHYYVRNWSLWLDAVIFLRTGRAVLQGSGAR